MFICPTRGRPDNLRRLVRAVLDTADNPHLPWLVRIDDDDPRLDDYRRINLPVGWKMEIGPRISCTPVFNEGFHKFPNEPWYGLMSDDQMPVTRHWDSTLIGAAGSDKMAYGADGIRDEAIAGMPIIGGDLARSIGWLQLPGLKRLYGDDALQLVMKRRNALVYCADVLIEHWHFSNGKAAMDETYAKPEAQEDRAIYEAWLSAGAPEGHTILYGGRAGGGMIDAESARRKVEARHVRSITVGEDYSA